MKTTTPVAVRHLVPCITFAGGCEEALNLYVSTIKNSRIVQIVRNEMHPAGGTSSVLHAEFELNGVPFTAMDGGPTFSFTEAFSIVVTLDTQEELDAVWDALLSGGGKESRCGWLTDRFGLSWQVVPAALTEMLSNPEGGNAGAVIEAFLKMGKMDIATLERAYRGE